MRKFILSLIIIFCFSQGLFAQSQPVSEAFPLYIEGRLKLGDDLHEFVLYRYVNAEWEQLPLQDFSDASLSPDGKWLAYTRVPPFLKDLLKTQGHQSGTSSDIVLLNLQDNSERIIAAQPETIAATENGYSGGIKRSVPVWAPDGNALAWREQDYAPGQARRLVTYDLESQESRILDTALPGVNFSADGMPENLSWGVPGVAVFANDDGPGNMPSVRLYDRQQGLQSAVILPFDEGPFGLYGPFWVGETPSEMDSDQVVIQTYQEQWYQVDPATGEPAPMQRQLEMVSATTPTESLRVLWNIYAEEGLPAWQLLAADGKIQLALDTAPLFVFSPSGQAVAYRRDGVLSLWQDGEATEIALPEGLSVSALHWGRTRWLAGHERPIQGGVEG